jgi:hypothetical protein
MSNVAGGQASLCRHPAFDFFDSHMPCDTILNQPPTWQKWTCSPDYCLALYNIGATCATCDILLDVAQCHWGLDGAGFRCPIFVPEHARVSPCLMEYIVAPECLGRNILILKVRNLGAKLVNKLLPQDTS